MNVSEFLRGAADESGNVLQFGAELALQSMSAEDFQELVRDMKRTASLELVGIVEVVYETETVSDKFSKRVFVINVGNVYNGNRINNFVKMECHNTRVVLLNGLVNGERVRVHFNPKGNKSDRDGKVAYFTSLVCWKVERLM